MCLETHMRLSLGASQECVFVSPHTISVRVRVCVCVRGVSLCVLRESVLRERACVW